jgi:hypothetical protein
MRLVKTYTNSLEAILQTLRLAFTSHKRRHYVGEGFEVRRTSTWDLQYIEGPQVLTIGTGIGKKRGGRWYEGWTTVELAEPLHWEPPFQDEKIGPEVQLRIKHNICRYFEAFGIPYEILE